MGPGRADLSGKVEPWGPEHRRGRNRKGLRSNSKLKGIILAAAPRLGSEWGWGARVTPTQGHTVVQTEMLSGSAQGAPWPWIDAGSPCRQRRQGALRV